MFVLSIPFQRISAQPYLDLLNTRFIYSPDVGLGSSRDHPVKMQNFNFSVNLPIQFKKTGDAILLTPFVENWKITWPQNEYESQDLWGFALPVGFLKQFPHSKWSLLSMIIPRLNAQMAGETENKLQLGGFLLAALKMNENLIFKAGAYYNQEFFGPFFIPLLGVDWKINDKSNLFGTLPNQLVYERKLNSRVYYGAATRFITNSYRLINRRFLMYDDNRYYRIDENQLGGFLDFYFTKKLVLNLELGHSILRKLETGRHTTSYSASLALNPMDNLYLKLSMAYRIRLR